ncbi:asparagine--tRNA ligase [Mucilaginibacter rubeus]|uniref:Asparagine--tRNA ligase n=1 Tax=Mucilaginibacter rubeus TaxID=2027860 RepID=A0AAE6MLY5_9SPHI|nr:MULTISPECIES: asparagine--tRNA ligase [Mucilaginibacter]QEM07732.1 asparagine--tRNA ligase [Mucilaginibacter rubeus]QEM20184.1 asparagine--tRNA ligase [Mucilaginibacter gossypii]QTE43102.1 asparagine--tRNA ligase [Mucilaginibacter rubeus]QTE49702.1 asparagine--tRNA ligase [Mucilaginibacter rubeus]QTE54795.1 asparagine--tRNA ligase [Mucilaginibacter rubeus]
MSQRTKIKALLQSQQTEIDVTVKGWVRAFRSNRFIALNDGSTNNNIQVVVDFENTDPALLKRITVGAALSVQGKLIASLGKGQTVEVVANAIEILGDCDPETYPLQLKNRPSLEFLREKAHLRFRTNTFGAIFRVRNSLAFAVHQFFQERGFVYLHTPIITASDAEGAGETFHVTNFDLDNIPKTDTGEIDFKQDFFGRATNLTVSGQLEGELGAMALSDIYTFGPTFRAENSNTTRHLAEFWMIEPEVAFNDLVDNMDLAEDMLKYVIKYALNKNADDIEFLTQRLTEEEKTKPQNERSEMTLLEKLQFCLNNDFERLTYTEAIDILKESPPNKKKKFVYPVEGWGTDLQSEHERYLVEKHFKKPVILTDYPKEIKAFYMRQNDDGKTVRAMDILFPGIGEIVGGSQREERLDKLEQRMNEMGIPTEELWWYLDTRRFGSCPHAGFGLGFERLVLFVTGMGNIRDVIPFPRFPKNAEF